MSERLLIFRPTLADGGADRVTVTLLRHLDRRRFQPTLVLVRKAGPLVDQVPVDVPVVELGVRRLALAAPALARLIRRERPGIIFSTAGGANSVVVIARMLARSSARLVLSERNALVRDTLSRTRLAIELRLKRVTYHRADLVTAVSEGVALDLIERLALPPERVRTVWNPVIGEDIAARAEEAVEHPWFRPGAPVLVACGRLVAQKDYPTMFRAFARVRQKYDARLCILGDGPLRQPLEAQLREMRLAEYVTFLGFDQNPFRYMARGDVFVQSSRAEGLPATLIQSMAVGTPPVATDCDFGPREVIRSGRDGWLVPVGNDAALADKIGDLLGNASRRSTFSTEARAMAARFEIPAAIARYERALLGEQEHAV